MRRNAQGRKQRGQKAFPGEYGRIQRETRNLACRSGCVSNPVVDQARQIYTSVSQNARDAVSETAGFAFRALESRCSVTGVMNLFSFWCLVRSGIGGKPSGERAPPRQASEDLRRPCLPWSGHTAPRALGPQRWDSHSTSTAFRT